MMQQVKIDPKNPPDVYEWTGPTGVHFREVREPSGTYYRDRTPVFVVHELERARRNRLRIRLFYGDKETGRDWGEECDTVGHVGRTWGPIKTPILLRACNSRGGPTILTDCIVRLFVDGIETYRHEKYYQPMYVIEPAPDKVGSIDMKKQGYKVQVKAIHCYHEILRTVVACFKTNKEAERWVAFMKGERMAR